MLGGPWRCSEVRRTKVEAAYNRRVVRGPEISDPEMRQKCRISMIRRPYLDVTDAPTNFRNGPPMATFPASAAAAGVALAGTTESVRAAADCMGGRAIVRDVPGNVARVAGVLGSHRAGTAGRCDCTPAAGSPGPG